MSDGETRRMPRKAVVPEGIDPDETPFELPPVFEGFPFDKNGQEAKAIREIIEEADRERAAAAERGPT